MQFVTAKLHPLLYCTFHFVPTFTVEWTSHMRQLQSGHRGEDPAVLHEPQALLAQAAVEEPRAPRHQGAGLDLCQHRDAEGLGAVRALQSPYPEDSGDGRCREDEEEVAGHTGQVQVIVEPG